MGKHLHTPKTNGSSALLDPHILCIPFKPSPLLLLKVGPSPFQDSMPPLNSPLGERSGGVGLDYMNQWKAKHVKGISWQSEDLGPPIRYTNKNISIDAYTIWHCCMALPTNKWHPQPHDDDDDDDNNNNNNNTNNSNNQQQQQQQQQQQHQHIISIIITVPLPLRLPLLLLPWLLLSTTAAAATTTAASRGNRAQGSKGSTSHLNSNNLCDHPVQKIV